MRIMPRSLLEWWKLDTQEGILRWLAERRMMPHWDKQKHEVDFEPHLNSSAKRHFREVLQHNTEDDVERVRNELTFRLTEPKSTKRT
jgi:hypothetical protein